MKTRYFTFKFLSIFLISGTSLSAQFDDLYYDYKKDNVVLNTSVASSSNQAYHTESEEIYDDQYAYDDAEYDNYDEYSYSSRIRRFHRPVVVNYYSSFDNWWYNDFYNPYNFGGVNVFIGNGWNSWNSPYAWNSWNRWDRPWGWNSYAGMGWNSWNSPWGWNNGWNNWGWNSWNGCPTNYGWGNNIYYGNVYYGNNWNNNNGNNWNNNGNNNANTIYGSRRGGSLTSSTKGRDNAPKRIVSGGGTGSGIGTNRVEDVRKIDDGTSASARSTSTRSYKGDISNPNTNSTEPVRNNSRSRIYSTDRSKSTEGISRSGGSTTRMGSQNDRSEAVKTDRSHSQNNTYRNKSESTSPSRTRTWEQNNSSSRSSSGSYDSGRSGGSSSRSYDSSPSRSNSSMGSSSSGGSRSSSSSGGSSRSGGSRRGG